jgi:NDP-sugar pyrophosphorylase family protein
MSTAGKSALEISKTQVVIGAGGDAKRMGLNIPKPLVELGGTTLLDRCIRMLAKHGFRDFVLLLGYEDKKVTKYLDKKDFGDVRITKAYDYAHGIEMGKAITHAIAQGAIDRRRRSLMIWPDDVFLDANLPLRVIKEHAAAVARLGTLASEVVATAYRSPYSLVKIDKRGIVTGFEEKPLVYTPASAGIYVFEPAAYKYFTARINLGKPGPAKFEDTVMPLLAKKRKIYAIKIPPESWIAVNTQKELEQAKKLVETGVLQKM